MCYCYKKPILNGRRVVNPIAAEPLDGTIANWSVSYGPSDAYDADIRTITLKRQ